MTSKEEPWVAGVDGCRAGWAVVFRPLFDGAEPKLEVFSQFAGIIEAVEDPVVVAVDMPIGLPDQIGAGGRGPETLVRPLLGDRQSSVFSIPSRQAVFAADYLDACTKALQTSQPQRKVSKQAYYLFPKIRELDMLLQERGIAHVYEVHPELAFWRLNGQKPASLPKKIKGRPNPLGLDERCEILRRFGFRRSFLDQSPPRGVGRDDLIDAAANAVIAERIHSGLAESFPSRPVHDSRGLPIAIWA